MLFRGFEGPAGTGKTHCLLEAVTDQIAQNPLGSHQRVLALTSMHGSRRRFEERFSGIAALRGQYTCVTIDSFAGHVAQRRKTLSTHLGVEPGNFEQTCDCGGRLLEENVVARWVAAAHPVVVVDEAQELSPARLRVVKALAPHVSLFIAADEFQCLDDTIDTGPFLEWFSTGEITALQQVRRTAQQGLLSAAAALRNGRAPQFNGAGLKIVYKFPNQVPFAIGHALHNGLARGGDVAVITAPGAKDWIGSMLPRLCAGMRTQNQTVQPLHIAWESQLDDEIARVLVGLSHHADISTDDVLAVIGTIDDPPPWTDDVVAAIRHQRRACGRTAWAPEVLASLVKRRAALHRAYGYSRFTGIPVMTIHGAKNRQFRHVIVLWPHGVPGDAGQQRRLLYNAITRAQISCTVFVRGRELLRMAPFA